MKTFPSFVFVSLAIGGAYASACSSSGPSGSGPGNGGGSGSGSGSGSGGTIILADGGGTASSSSGGTSSSSSGGTEAPPSSQCTDLATATCAQVAKCDTFDMEQAFGNDMTTCIARLVFSCPSVTEPGTSNTTASIEACATAVGQIASCTAYAAYFSANNGLLCPTPPGTLPDGTACLDDSQCKGGFCGAPSTDGGSSTSSCGACAEKPAPTSCQENSNCASGQVCNANGTCVAPGGAGATCDDSDPEAAVQPCLPSSYCQLAAASDDAGAPATGTCTPLGTAGKACNANDDASDCADGLFCNAQSVCAAIQFVALGATCDDVELVCKEANCLFSSAQDASCSTGVCTAFVTDGAACQTDEDCQFNAGCVAGKCSTATPTCD